MFQTLKNAWKVADIRSKLLFTLLIVILYRLGANIPVPYVDSHVFEEASAFFQTGILQYLNIMSGEALAKATLFALGVSPYITSSIVIQLLTVAFPKLQEWSKDGENGRKRINFLTRIVTVALALMTSIGYVFFLNERYFLIELSRHIVSSKIRNVHIVIHSLLFSGCDYHCVEHGLNIGKL